MIEPSPTKVTGLDVFCNPYRLRRDIHAFVRYVQERDVKRLHRNNNLGKADSMRLAKAMSDPEAVAEVKESGGSAWGDYVDAVALKLGFVSYDTEGSYAGYSSSEPSFPDNYVQFNDTTYRRFLKSSPARQERWLLDALVEDQDGCESEFYRTGILGSLGGFSRRGCATGIVPMLNFVKIRRFLLDLLQTCQAGVWYSTALLIQHLKTVHPFFLIPQEPKHKNRWDRQEGRYGNFSEGADLWGSDKVISEQAPDAFERVEGRYVERFLESVPLALGYLDVAYSRQPYKGVYPPIGTLEAFRVNDRLLHAMQGDIPAPKVTVQPNFEVLVESEFYPVSVLSQLIPLVDVVSEDVLTTLRLRKEKVAARLTQDAKLDVVALLTRLTGRELPGNVARELAEWSEHSEKFVLYNGFALLEGDEDLLTSDSLIGKVTIERISSTVRVIRSPAALFARLEQAELMPLRIEHAASALCSLPPKARTVFAQESCIIEPAPEEQEKERAPAILRRHTTIMLHFPDGELLEKFRQAALGVRCPVEVDKRNRSVTFSRRYEPQVIEIIQALKEYVIHIEDIE